MWEKAGLTWPPSPFPFRWWKDGYGSTRLMAANGQCRAHMLLTGWQDQDAEKVLTAERQQGEHSSCPLGFGTARE